MCECIEAVNAKLKEAGHNTVVKTPIILSGGPARSMVVTQKADSAARKKPIDLFASFCPFCGENYKQEAKS